LEFTAFSDHRSAEDGRDDKKISMSLIEGEKVKEFSQMDSRRVAPTQIEGREG
jgi:hypothetical protein